jgi:hypothetical protein
MPYVESIEDEDDKNLLETEWKEVERVILSRAKLGKRFLQTLQGPDDSCLILGYAPDFGYYISLRTEDDEPKVLTDIGQKSVVEASVEPAGHGVNKEFRQRFVPERMAMVAVRCFYENGTRDSILEWRSPIEDGSADMYEVGAEY